MNFGKHIHLTIEHNPHSLEYTTAEKYIQEKIATEGWCDDDFISPEDKQKCIDSNDFWTIQWYPNTPVSFFYVVGSDLEKCLNYMQEAK